MENLDLTNYIQQARKSGMEDNKIREGLLQAGWPVSSIEEATMSKENPKQSLKIQNSKTSIHNAVVVILVLGIAVTGHFAGAYYMANYKNFPLWPFEVSVPVPTFTSRPSPVAIPDSTADWQTYRNDEYGFEVKYSSDWTFKLDDGITFNPAKGIFDLVKLGPRQNPNGVSFDDGATLGFMVADNLNGEIKKYTTVGKGEDPFSANDFSGFKYITDGGELINAYQTSLTGKVFVFTWSRANIYNSNDFSYQKYLLPILSTFRFTK